MTWFDVCGALESIIHIKRCVNNNFEGACCFLDPDRKVCLDVTKGLSVK